MCYLTGYTFAMTFEVEIKSLLGNAERADALRAAMQRLDVGTKLVAKGKQLNHYFTGGNLQALFPKLYPYFSEKQQEKLRKIGANATEFSVRTRQKDDAVLFVVKASVDDTTSSNGIARMEFEEKVSLSLQELDQVLLDNGFAYQAKWSREREEYVCKGTNVCLDKNAGYGYLAEFERVVEDEGALSNARQELALLMQELGAVELPQERLERMFEHYNANWPEYYGTDKIFVIE